MCLCAVTLSAYGVEEVQLSIDDASIAPAAINPDINCGTVKINQAINFRNASNVVQSGLGIPAGTYTAVIPYTLPTGTTTIPSNDLVQKTVSATSQLVITSSFNFSVSSGTEFLVEKSFSGGAGETYVYGGTAYIALYGQVSSFRQSTSAVTTYTGKVTSFIPATSAALTVNGKVITDFVSKNANGYFSFPAGTYVAGSEGISSVGVLFRAGSSLTFPVTVITGSSSSTATQNVIKYSLGCSDDFYFVRLEPPLSDYSADLAGILAAINTVISRLNSVISQNTALSSLVDKISGFTSGIRDLLTSSSQQDAQASQFLQDIQDTTQQIEDTNQIIEDNTYRPSMEELRPPDVSAIIDSSDAGYMAAMEGIGTFLSADFIVNILLLMCTMAFCGYVLFGKRG